MAVIGNTYLDLVDLAKSGQLDGLEIDTVEALHTLNPLMIDAVTVECNNGTKHRQNIRTGLPGVAWGKLYKGIPQAKSTMQQVEDTTGFVEGLSEVDCRLLDIAPNPAALRMSEAEPFLEAISQDVQTGFFYNDVTVNGERFHGLAARYSSLPVAGVPASDYVVDGGGVGSDNMSIWFVTHGVNQTSLITPAGVPGGIQRVDKGEHMVQDASGDNYFAKLELFRQHVGVAVRDYRFNSRVANIDVSDVIAGTVAINPLMRKAFYKMQKRRNPNIKNGGMISAGNTVIYMNSTALEALDAEGANAGASDNFVRLKPMEVQGQEVMTWRGMPIRETDALINTETALT